MRQETEARSSGLRPQVQRRPGVELSSDSVKVAQPKTIDAIRGHIRANLTFGLSPSFFGDHHTLNNWVGEESSQINEFALELALGEMAGATLEGQRASAEKAIALGYAFAQPLLGPALRNLLG